MIATLDELKHKEHMLAEKAENILQHQQDLQLMQRQLKSLKEDRPTTDKDQLTYKESIEFGKKVENYEADLNHAELQIQKLERELTALEHQAKKLIPVSGVKVQVTTDSRPSRTFCIELLESSDDSHSEVDFRVKQLK